MNMDATQRVTTTTITTTATIIPTKVTLRGTLRDTTTTPIITTITIHITLFIFHHLHSLPYPATLEEETTPDTPGLVHPVWGMMPSMGLEVEMVEGEAEPGSNRTTTYRIRSSSTGTDGRTSDRNWVDGEWNQVRIYYQ